MIPTKVPFMDLAAQWRDIESAATPDLSDLFAASAFCLGPWVERFETAFAQHFGASHAVGVNSGTSALHLALIVAGVSRGDEVLVPANTFIATVWAVLYVGAIPVLCDVDPASWTIDVGDAEARITSKTKAIIPVHLYGQLADMAAVTDMAERHGLAVIEDAAQALGAELDGRRPGQFGRLGCFSFYPGKNLGAAGEGGLVVTGDPETADRLRRLRHHAQAERYVHTELGFNYRMEGIQGLVLWHKLQHFEAWMDRRREIARCYQSALDGLPITVPQEVRGRHAWHLFVIHTPHRQALQDHLAREGIATGLHYPMPLHRQPCLSDIISSDRGFPNSDLNASQCLSLPLHPALKDEQVEDVVRSVRSFFDGGIHG